jgi:hypothetical protein
MIVADGERSLRAGRVFSDQEGLLLLRDRIVILSALGIVTLLS